MWYSLINNKIYSEPWPYKSTHQNWSYKVHLGKKFVRWVGCDSVKLIDGGFVSGKCLVRFINSFQIIILENQEWTFLWRWKFSPGSWVSKIVCSQIAGIEELAKGSELCWKYKQYWRKLPSLSTYYETYSNSSINCHNLNWVLSIGTGNKGLQPVQILILKVSAQFSDWEARG